MRKSGNIVILSFFLSIIIHTGALSQVEEKTWTEPANLRELNSPDNEFAPCWDWYRNLFYFNSDRTGESLFYISSFEDSLSFKTPETMKGSLNNTGSNQSYMSLLNENKAVVSTFRMSGRRSFLNLYETGYSKKSWLKPILIDNLAVDAFESHPAVSPDGKFMIFVSDRNSEYGDTDLWIVYYQDNGVWSGEMSVSELNTNGNEITPFLASPDTLYFASDGLGGPGGYDIYMSARENGIWQNPYPAAELNTVYNESDFALLPGGKAVFSSDRPGGTGELDLYITYIKENPDIQNSASDMELSLSSTYYSRIKSEIRLSYSAFSFFPYIISSYETPCFPDYSFNPDKIPPSPDSVYKYSLALLAKRMADNPFARLDINLFLSANDVPDETVKLADSIKNYFEKIWGVDENRITIISGADSLNNPAPVDIFFSSPDKSLFAPVKAGESESGINPEAAEIQLIARPEEALSSWNCRLKFNDKLTDIIANGDNKSEPFVISLKDFEEEIVISDSLIIIAEAKDSAGRMAYASLFFDVSRSTSKSVLPVIFKGKKYESFTVDCNFVDKVFIKQAYEEMVNMIIESANGSERRKEIYIFFQPENPAGIQYAENLLTVLEKSLPGKKIKIVPGADFAPSYSRSGLSQRLLTVLVALE